MSQTESPKLAPSQHPDLEEAEERLKPSDAGLADGIPVSRARILLFAIWASMFVIYLFFFLACDAMKNGVTSQQARDAAWNIAYVLIPILTSFGSFWFTPGGPDEPSPKGVVPKEQALMLFVFTGLFHVIVSGYFLLSVAFVNFDEPVEPVSWSENVDFGMKLLLLVSALGVLPVGYLLGGHAPKQLPGGGTIDPGRKRPS